MKEGNEHTDWEEPYSKAVRAGKRTYFFDVRATRDRDYYLTITESKRNYAEDGSYSYKKHKIFLYKEDFEKFGSALTESIRKIIDLKREQGEQMLDSIENEFSDINFEDLGPTSHETSNTEADYDSGHS